VPDGSPASEGTYVRYDHEALVGILVLEAHRAGAVVVGEDLGVVEPWVRTYLQERGLLGTSVVWFEKGWSGEPLAPEHWREACLATVTTHDLPPTAGYLGGEHLDIRERLGLLTRPVEEERAADRADQDAVLDTLRGLGLVHVAGPDVDDVVVALHAMLARTPCRFVGVALADAVGDRRAVNQPGTDREYPNWCVPLTDGDGVVVVLDELCRPGGAPLAARLAAVLQPGGAQ
jgi:4-alpha-glucanotransferase